MFRVIGKATLQANNWPRADHMKGGNLPFAGGGLCGATTPTNTINVRGGGPEPCNTTSFTLWHRMSINSFTLLMDVQYWKTFRHARLQCSEPTVMQGSRITGRTEGRQKWNCDRGRVPLNSFTYNSCARVSAALWSADRDVHLAKHLAIRRAASPASSLA